MDAELSTVVRVFPWHHDIVLSSVPLENDCDDPNTITNLGSEELSQSLIDLCPIPG